MNKGEEIIRGFREIIKKLIWLDTYKMKEALSEYKPSEIHCIDYIGKHAGTNVTEMAEAFHMTTGGVTKLTKKLARRNLIESYQSPKNRKEIYFRLTDSGKAVYDIHEKLHMDFHERDRAVLEDVTDEDYRCMIRFIELYGKHLDQIIEKLEGVENTEGLDTL